MERFWSRCAASSALPLKRSHLTVLLGSPRPDLRSEMHDNHV